MKDAMRRSGPTLLIVLTAACLANCSSFETENAAYATVKDARAAGAVEALSIPAYLPEGASYVLWRYNIDSHETWLAFRADSLSRQFISDQCRSIETRMADFPRRDRPSWWPGDLPANDGYASVAYSV